MIFLDCYNKKHIVKQRNLKSYLQLISNYSGEFIHDISIMYFKYIYEQQLLHMYMQYNSHKPKLKLILILLVLS